MKKILIGAAIALGVGAVVFAGVATLRPGLLPKVGLPTSKAEKADYGLYCKEHGVPEKFCTLCHPELKEKLLLCPEHGNIPEDICTKCHPENAEKYDITPCDHGLPAHFCPKCHPENFKEGGSASAGPHLDPSRLSDSRGYVFRMIDGEPITINVYRRLACRADEAGKALAVALTCKVFVL